MKRIGFLILGMLLTANLSWAGGDIIFPWNEEEMSVHLGTWTSEEYGVVVTLKQREDFCALFVKDEAGFGLGQTRIPCGQQVISENLEVAATSADVYIDLSGGRKSMMIVEESEVILEKK